jgi:hypothetical protein
MQKNMDDWSNNPDSPPRKKSRTRTKFARFLFGVLGSVLLVAVAAATMVPKLIYIDLQAANTSISGTE